MKKRAVGMESAWCDFRFCNRDSNYTKSVFSESNINSGTSTLSLVPDIAKNKKISYDGSITTLIAEAKCD